MEAPEEFVRFLRDFVEKNGGAREVGRRAGLSHTLILNTINLGEKPSFDTCVALAPVLGMTPLNVLYSAGLLPQPPGWKPNLDEAIALLSRMSEAEQDQHLAFMRVTVEQGEREKKSNP